MTPPEKQECWACQYWTGSPYLKCTVHPIEQVAESCLDYVWNPEAKPPLAINGTLAPRPLERARDYLRQSGQLVSRERINIGRYYGSTITQVLTQDTASLYSPVYEVEQETQQRHYTQLQEFKGTLFGVVQTCVEAHLSCSEQLDNRVVSEIEDQINQMCAKLYRYGFFPNQICIGLGRYRFQGSALRRSNLRTDIEVGLESLWEHINHTVVLHYMNDPRRVPLSTLLADRPPLSRRYDW